MRVHLISICGSGMGALAQMLKASGHEVSGSDANFYPPMSTQLQNAGIDCRVGFSAQNIDSDTELVVVGNAVSSSNAEVQEVLKRNIPCLSLPQALGRYFLKDRLPIVVAGTHGKTTTSALLAWVLESAGRDPGIFVGGWAKNFAGSGRVGSGPFFVVEGDEYDTAFFDKGPKFLNYNPAGAVLTSIEFDHADIYKNLEHLKSAFRDFVRLIPPTGFLMAASGDGNVDEVIGDLSCQIVRYGPGEEPFRQGGWGARAIRWHPQGGQFEVIHPQIQPAQVQTPLLGLHNLRNTLAVIGAAHRLGLPMDEILRGIATFRGVRRRQDVVGVVDGITVMDDFAHHPTAIRETLSGIRMGFPQHRIWAIFEPRSATSRRRIFQDAFVEAFGDADRVIVADLFSREKIQPEDRLDPRKLAEDLRKRNKDAWFIPTADEIVAHLHSRLESGDLVVIMSSGGFGSIHTKLLSALQQDRTEPSASRNDQAPSPKTR